MIRTATPRAAGVVALGVLLGWVAASSAADLPVAPPPREVRADGSRDPAPVAEAKKKEDPREVVGRIIKNSNAVGDRLAKTDTGTDTRKTQATILKDIDALLDQDNPPPKSDQNQDKDKNQDMNQDMKDMKSDMPMPMGGTGDKKMDQQPMGNTGTGMDQQPMGGTGGGGNQPMPRRPRQGGDQQKEAQPKDGGKQPGGGGNQPKKEPTGNDPKNAKNSGGKFPDPHGDKTPPSARPLFPTEEDAPKNAWGHLPERLRQQATQYYKQEFMPRYAELLKQYYSTPMGEKK